MADTKTNTAAQAQTRIDLDQVDGLEGWAKKFDVTPDQIREAVQAVGDQAADVEMHLKGTRSTTNADQEARAESGTAGSQKGS